MKDRIWNDVVRALLVGAAFLSLCLGAAFDDSRGLALRHAAAASIQSPAPGNPRIGGTLKFGIVKDIGTPIPFVAYTSVSQYAKDNLYEPLVMNDPKGEIQPWLAESWTPNANSSEWIFKIRRGVKFHDGKERPQRTWSGPLNTS